MTYSLDLGVLSSVEHVTSDISEYKFEKARVIIRSDSNEADVYQTKFTAFVNVGDVIYVVKKKSYSFTGGKFLVICVFSDHFTFALPKDAQSSTTAETTDAIPVIDTSDSIGLLCDRVMKRTLTKQREILDRLQNVKITNLPTRSVLDDVSAQLEEWSTNVLFALAQFDSAHEYQEVRRNHDDIQAALQCLDPWIRLNDAINGDSSELTRIIDIIKTERLMPTI